MSEEQQSSLEQATDLVNSGNYIEALERSRSILVTDPTNGDARLIEAISLSNLGNVSDASEAFASAMEMVPDNVRIRFNAAVHETNAGNAEQARSLAKSVLDSEPDHQGAKDLLARLDLTSGPQVAPGSYPRQTAASIEVPYEGIAFLRNHGPLWTAIGWAISALSILFFIYFWATMIPHLGDFSAAASSPDKDATKKLMASTATPLLMYAPLSLLLPNVIYMIMDIIHRKGSFTWLFAHIPCSCIGALGGGNCVILPIYMLLGRK